MLKGLLLLVTRVSIVARISIVAEGGLLRFMSLGGSIVDERSSVDGGVFVAGWYFIIGSIVNWDLLLLEGLLLLE